MESSQKLGEIMYQQAQGDAAGAPEAGAAGGAPGGAPGPDAGAGQAKNDDDNIVDADFKVVDDK